MLRAMVFSSNKGMNNDNNNNNLEMNKFYSNIKCLLFVCIDRIGKTEQKN